MEHISDHITIEQTENLENVVEVEHACLPPVCAEWLEFHEIKKVFLRNVTGIINFPSCCEHITILESPQLIVDFSQAINLKTLVYTDYKTTHLDIDDCCDDLHHVEVSRNQSKSIPSIRSALQTLILADRTRSCMYLHVRIDEFELFRKQITETNRQ